MADTISELPKEVMQNESVYVSWPDIDRYNQRKVSTVKKYKPQFFSMIDQNEKLFSNLNENEKNDLAEMMATFAFGVRMVYSRFGEKYKEISIAIPHEPLKNVYFGVSEKERQYVFNPFKLSDTIRGRQKTDKFPSRAVGIQSPDLLDFFEIGGVEEGAHYLFMNEKNGIGKAGLPSMDLGYEYHTSDIESRALLWKLSYVKKYMPQYEPELHVLNQKVFAARRLLNDKPSYE